MKHKLTFLTLLVLAMASCKKAESPVGNNIIQNDIIEVTIQNSETYTYSTGISGDEDGAAIKVQATNFEVSELKRNQTTNWEAIYYYTPNPNFTGKDYVEIETFESLTVSGSQTMTNTIKILINVTE